MPYIQPHSKQVWWYILLGQVVLTSHAQLGDTGHTSGFWLEKLACPYYRFLDADVTVPLAPIQGGQAPLASKSHLNESQIDDNRRY